MRDAIRHRLAKLEAARAAAAPPPWVHRCPPRDRVALARAFDEYLALVQGGADELPEHLRGYGFPHPGAFRDFARDIEEVGLVELAAVVHSSDSLTLSDVVAAEQYVRAAETGRPPR
jgi:hypothetical protein